MTVISIQKAELCPTVVNGYSKQGIFLSKAQGANYSCLI